MTVLVDRHEIKLPLLAMVKTHIEKRCDALRLSEDDKRACVAEGWRSVREEHKGLFGGINAGCAKAVKLARALSDLRMKNYLTRGGVPLTREDEG